MLDPVKIKWAIKSGLSAVCANCIHYWRAQQHVPESRPVEGFKPIEAHCPFTDCCGPSFGKAFPRYDGPYKGKLATICYICGAEADAAIEMHGRGFIGVCDRHIEQFKSHLRKPNAPPPTVNERIVPVV